MAYNQQLAERVEKIVNHWPDMNSKKMFGGIGYLMNGNMVCGIHKENLILRLGTELAESALEQPGIRVFDITGRPMKGWVMTTPETVADEAVLQEWLDQARSFVETLPLK